MPASVDGQIFVTTGSDGIGRVSEYTTSGATINASLVTGRNLSPGIAVSGSTLFVTDNSAGTVAAYTTSGATLNTALISGLSTPWGIEASGDKLYVVSGGNRVVGTIGEYTTSGAIVNASLVSGLTNPEGIALSGSNLFVVYAGNHIGKYTTAGGPAHAPLISGNGFQFWRGIAVSGDKLFVTDVNAGTISEFTTSGAIVNATLVSGLNRPSDIEVFGGHLFVTNSLTGSIGEYTMTGEVVNASLIAKSGSTYGIAIVPEPSAWALLATGILLLLGRRFGWRAGYCGITKD